jgi:hypothetical protein
MAQIILDSNNNLIQGDFDNATLNNRTKLQTTTTNATTNVYVVPNGSSTSAGVSVANNSSLTDASKIVMATNGSTDTQIISGVNGSGSYLPLSFYTNNTLAAQISTSANLSFNSGYGSAAVAYGCRAWVIFNGIGTIAIVGSGNISSLADIGVGDYRINFTNSMPNTNYACVFGLGNGGSEGSSPVISGGQNGAGQAYIYIKNAGSAVDYSMIQMGIFR